MEAVINMFWIITFTVGFCLLLCCGEFILDILYNFVPPFRHWTDRRFNDFSNHDEEVKKP